MFTIFLVMFTLLSAVLGRIVLGSWWNHLSIISGLYGAVLVLFAGGVIGNNAISDGTWVWLCGAWACVLWAWALLRLLRGLPSPPPVAAKSWQRAYRCRISQSSIVGQSNIGWSLFILFGMQAILLGASDDLDSDKVAFAIVYVLFLGIWLKRMIALGVSTYEPTIRWTIALLALAIFSRLTGVFSGITTLEWLRDFLPLLHFSWILIGPFAFRKESIGRAFLILVALTVVLTFVVTDQYLTLRKFSSLGLGWTEYARASDAVVLFGIFMVLPMTTLAGVRNRLGFGILAALFVTAALLTGTRSHVAALTAGLIFYLWLTKPRGLEAGLGRRAVMASVLVGVVVFAVALGSGFLDAQQVLQRTAETSTLSFGALTQRLGESVAAWNGFMARPVFGQGLGYRMPTALWSIQESSNDLFFIHNFYLYVPLKFGLVGIPIFAGFLISLLRTGISTCREATQPFDRAFAAGLSCLLVALLVESATASRFQDRSATALLSIVLALLLSIRRNIAEAAGGTFIIPPEPHSEQALVQVSCASPVTTV